jgi:preprotein translocase SecE subunit
MKNFFAKFKGYMSEIKGEAKRVSWPDKRELYDSTIVVIAFIFILAATTLVCDRVIQLVVNMIAGA